MSKVEWKCENCGEKRLLPEWEAEKRRFCDLECCGENNKTGDVISCAECGKQFYRSKSYIEEYDNNFCSSECATRYSRTGENKQCDNCDDKIYVRERQLEKYDTHFCSMECANEYRTGSNHPNWNRVSVRCWYCGEELERIQARVDKTERQFCDADCRSKWKSWAEMDFDKHGNFTGDFGKDGPRWEYNPDILTKDQLRRMGVYD